MSILMKSCHLVLIAVVVLAEKSSTAAVLPEEQSHEGGSTVESRYLKPRKRHHHHRHRKAIQGKYSHQAEPLAYDDDVENAYGKYRFQVHEEEHLAYDHGIETGYGLYHVREAENLAYDDDIEAGLGHAHVASDNIVHYPQYLDEDINPLPFRNCIPESFHENNRHGGKHHHHKHGHHHHKYGGLDHHHHKHKHTAYPDELLGNYYSNGKGKGVGKAGKAKSAKSKAAKGSKGGKGKGLYYRQRNLAHRRGHTGARDGRRGFRGRRFRGRVHGRQGHGDYEAIFKDDNDRRQVKKDTTKEYDQEGDEEDSELKTGKNHHPHAHTHEKGGLPLCPSVAPKRRTFEPIPTVAPRESPSGGTSMPTVPSEEGVPVDTPPGTQRVLVQSALSFGFFGDATNRRAPTMEEINGLLERTSEWYTTQLQASFPNLESFEAALVDVTTDLSASEPIKIDFDANGFFTQGKQEHVLTLRFCVVMDSAIN